VGELWCACDVTSRPYAIRCRAEVFIDSDESSLRQFHANTFEIDSVGHWISAHSDEDVVSGHGITSGARHGHRAVGIPSDFLGPRTQVDRYATIVEHLLDRGGNIGVFSGEELIAALDDGHLHPDRVRKSAN
jgi:hypothetical protein